MRKRLKSSQPKNRNVAKLIKKTAIGSLVGVLALGTLPATIGTTFAAPEPVEAPLVIKGGWQPALEKIQMIQLDSNSNSGDFSELQPERPIGLIAQHSPVNPLNPESEEGATILSFSNYDAKSLYFGVETQGQATFGGGPVIYAEEEVAVNDIALGTFTQSESSPAAFGTGEGNGNLGPNVYRLVLPELTSKYVQAKPLIEEGTIEDPQGIDMTEDNGDTLYVAGGRDGHIWKLTKNYEIDSVNEPLDATDSDETSVSEDVYGNNEFSDGNISVLGAGYEYSAEVFATFGAGSKPTDVVYDEGELYVADAGLNRVVKIDLNAPEQLQPVATGLNEPQSIALDNNNLYIADTGNNQVKKVNVANGQVEILAGTGEGSQSYKGVPAVQSSLTEPKGIAVDQATGSVYVADVGRVQKLVDKFFYQQIRDENGDVWNLVENAEGLDHVRDDLEGNYKLVNDISKQDLDNYLLEKNGDTNWKPIGNSKDGFAGQFDGGNHNIEGLSISNRSGGLFGALYEAKVGYLNLTKLNIASFQTTGGLAAYAGDADIFRVSVEGNIVGSRYVGGLIGALRDSDIQQSFFNGSVEGSSGVGGLIGSAEFDSENGMSKIHNNYVWGSVLQMRYLVMNMNEVSIATIDKDLYAGFVGRVSFELSNDPASVTNIFMNNYASVEADAPHEFDEFAELWSFAGADREAEFIPSSSNYWNTKANAGKPTEVVKAKALNDQEMKKQDNFVGWDFTKIWMMDPVSGYPILRPVISEQPTTPPVTPPTTPSTGGGTSTPIVTTPPASNTTIINVNVQNDKTTNGSVVASLAITRTKGTDGTTKDVLQLTPAKATEIINLLKASGSKTAAIVLPDDSDEVSQWDLTVPGAASKLLTDEGVELVILNPNVRITVPASSLTGITDDLYFRLIPVKSTATSEEIQARALANQEIVETANDGDITVVGRPMTIETNLQSRPVTLILPLPANSNFTAAQQKKLGVYIEHSDGTKQLVPGTVVTQEDGTLGLEITVNHFSTFTIVNVSNWGSTLIASPYILGYADGSFKPAQNITRAELAAIVGRITGVTEGTATFSDVKNGSWASEVVGPAAASGVMTGYSDGTFKPNASITRGELASALAKLLPQSGLDASGQAAGFSDLAASHWAATAAAQLQVAGVVTGYADGSFKPEQNVTRAEAVTMINRLVGLDGSMALPGAAAWNDVTNTYWAYDAVRAASMQR